MRVASRLPRVSSAAGLPGRRHRRVASPRRPSCGPPHRVASASPRAGIGRAGLAARRSLRSLSTSPEADTQGAAPVPADGSSRHEPRRARRSRQTGGSGRRACEEGSTCPIRSVRSRRQAHRDERRARSGAAPESPRAERRAPHKRGWHAHRRPPALVSQVPACPAS
jgi:hypothetical protein